MPDISMCSNEHCLNNVDCFRFVAKPSGHQTYALFDESKCDFFMSTEGISENRIDWDKITPPRADKE